MSISAQGEENPFVLSRVYDVDWICEYDMAWYPFDTQSCGMVFEVSHSLSTNCQKQTFLPQTEGNSGEFVELVLSGLEYTGPKDLTQYFIRNTSMALGVRNEVEVTVVLGR